MTPVLRFKDGVTLGDPPTPTQVRLLAVCDQGARLLNHTLTVTCGREGHAPTDPHTRGQAIDLRTATLSEAQILALVDFLRKLLGPAFTVLYETRMKPLGVLAGIAYVNPAATANHLHLQPLKGTTWPPEA